MRFFFGIVSFFLFPCLSASIFIFNKSNAAKVARGSEEKRVTLLKKEMKEYLEEAQRLNRLNETLYPWTASGAIFLWLVKSGNSDWIIKLSNQALPQDRKISKPKFRWNIGGRIGLSKDLQAFKKELEAFKKELSADVTFFSSKGRNPISTSICFPSNSDTKEEKRLYLLEE